MAVLRLTNVSDRSRELPGYWDQRMNEHWHEPTHGLYVNRTGLDRMDARNLRVLRNLVAGRGVSVLECACGYGRYFESFARYTPEVRSYLGIDVAERNIVEAKRLHGDNGGSFQVADMATIKTAERFDLIFMVAAMSSIESRSQEIIDHLKTLLLPAGSIAIFEEDCYMIIDGAWNAP